MLDHKPHLRYSLRAAALFLAMLGLWWLVLRGPMLASLRAAESIALALASGADPADCITTGPSGDWNLRVPVSDSPRPTREGAAVRFQSIEFSMPRADLALFTFALPVFWAMILAAPWGRSGARALAWGTAAVALIEVLALLAQVEIGAYAALDQMHLAGGGLAAWFRDYGARLIVGAVPTAVPAIAAIALDRDLRRQIFERAS